MRHILALDANNEADVISGKLTVSNLRSALAGPFNVSVAPGTCLAVTGASGSGKSLFLRMIADLDPNEGDVALGEASRSGMPANEWRKRVIYLAAESGWWADDVASHFRNDQVASASALLNQLGLSDELIRGPVARLSTGERQRIALVRGLVLSPAVLLLDEPTSGLDEGSVAKVEDILRARMDGGMSIVLVTHDDRQARRMSAHCLRMAQGRLEVI